MKNKRPSMNINSIKRIILGCTFAIVVLICLSRIADAQVLNINKVVFASQYVNGEAKGVAQIFSPKDRTIYCVVGLTNPVPNAKFKFVWTQYDKSQGKQVSIFEQELSNQSTKTVAGKISSPKDWTIGQYNVEIYVDGRVKKKLTYNILKEQF